LPIRNRQSSISPLVSHLLEVLPDLTPRFDVVVIDDGSNDATGEIAHDLALLYPQVFVVAHPAPWGPSASMRSGLLHSSADTVLYRSESCRLGWGCLEPLWQAVRTHDVAVARAADDPLNGEPGLQMIRRQALDAWRRDADDDNWQAYLVGRHYRCVELALDRPTRLAPRGRSIHLPGAGVSQVRGTAEVGTRRPNYLARIKAFALGE
jgi:hypothetical protein